MVRSFVIAAASAAVIAIASPRLSLSKLAVLADEARAMLMKAVAAVQADKAKALDMFNKGEGGFRDRDLYVFCVNASDGTIVAIGNPNTQASAWHRRARCSELYRQGVWRGNLRRDSAGRKVKSPRSTM